MSTNKTKSFGKQFSDSLDKSPTLKLIVRLLVLANAGIWSAVLILATNYF